MREKKSEGPAPLPVFGQGHLSFWLQIPSQPLLTPELATGPRKLLKQPSGNPTFPLPHARNSGAPCAEQLQQKKTSRLWMNGGTEWTAQTHTQNKMPCSDTHKNLSLFAQRLCTLWNHPPSNCNTPTPSVDPNTDPLARPRTTIQQVAYATPLRLHLKHSHSVTTKHISLF